MQNIVISIWNICRPVNHVLVFLFDPDPFVNNIRCNLITFIIYCTILKFIKMIQNIVFLQNYPYILCRKDKHENKKRDKYLYHFKHNVATNFLICLSYLNNLTFNETLNQRAYLTNSFCNGNASLYCLLLIEWLLIILECTLGSLLNFRILPSNVIGQWNIRGWN